MTNDNDNQPAAIAHVVPWEPGEFGVAIDLPNGTRTAYAVAGSRTVAEGECRRINNGGTPVFGPWAGRDLRAWALAAV